MHVDGSLLAGTVDGQECIQRLELDLHGARQTRHQWGSSASVDGWPLGQMELGEAGLRALLRLPTQASSSTTGYMV